MRGDNLYVWIAQQLEESVKFADGLARLGSELQRPRRATMRFAEFESVEAMLAEVDRRRRLDRLQRPYAWSQDRVRRDSWTEPCEPATDLLRCAQGAMRLAHTCAGATAAANPLLAYAQGARTEPPIPLSFKDRPSPRRSIASAAAAHIRGDVDFSSAENRRKGFERALGGREARLVTADDFSLAATGEGEGFSFVRGA